MQQLIPSPDTTVVICKNYITVSDEASYDAKQTRLPSTYAGDICPALKNNQFPEFIQIRWGYDFRELIDSDDSSEDDQNTIPWKWSPFFQQINNTTKKAQILFIQPPIQQTFDHNYLSQLISNYKSLTNLSSFKNHTLSKDIIALIFDYLPFTFPIFISCTSIHRGRLNYTHWTYPYSKSKEWILHYLKKCEKTFNENKDCYYISEWYLMEDDAPIKFQNKDVWRQSVHDKLDLLIDFKQIDKCERVWNEPILIARKESNKLCEVIQDRNTVGGSYWLTMGWNKSDENVEWYGDGILEDGVDRVYSEIGGSSGIKSRCWYQTIDGIHGKYLPMSVLNVCCNYKMLQNIVREV